MDINEYIAKKLPVLNAQGKLWYRFEVAYDGVKPFFTRPELAAFVRGLKSTPCFKCVFMLSRI